MRFSIVAFNHPLTSRSVIYRQNLTETQLINAIRNGIEKGANLFSIRGFENEEESTKPKELDLNHLG